MIKLVKTAKGKLKIAVVLCILAVFLGCESKEVITYISPNVDQSNSNSSEDIKAEENIKNFLSPSISKLKKAENCAEVKEYVEALMEKYAEKLIKDMREKAYSYSGDYSILESGQNFVYNFKPVDSGKTIEHSETTVQEKGVDEADIVKTDGERIYSALSGRLIVVRSYPTDNAEVLANIPVIARELLIEGTKIFTFGESGNYNFYISEFDGLEKPELVRAISVEGRYITARKKEGKIFVIGDRSNQNFFSTNNPIISKIIEIAMNTASDIQKVEIEIGFEDIKEIFPKIEEISYSISYSNGTTSLIFKRDEYKIDCSNVYISSDASGIDSAFVVLLEPGKKPEIIYAIGVGSTSDVPFVYMSKNSIYVAYSKDRWFWGDGAEEKTIIHKFDISDEVKYSASGEVEGRISVIPGRTGQKNAELSMNEYNGFLRIATSKGNFGNSDNIVSVLKEEDGKLKVVGQVKGIAPGELIHSARFMGDRGFIVTFKKTDPFFTLDLKNPYNPLVVGELKVSGYSSLILPFGENYVLTIGKETEDMGDFAWYQGVQLSIFDVSDLSSPRLLHRIEIGSRGTESEALYDYRALTLFKNVLSIPIYLYEGGSGGPNLGSFKLAGFSVYRVSVDNGFEHVGYIKGCECKNCNYYTYSYACSPIRSVIIGNVIWSLMMLSSSKISILASDIGSLTPLKELEVNF